MSADVIPFPAWRARRPSTSSISGVAVAIYTDMLSRLRFGGPFVEHSIADGIACSGAGKVAVVKARRELQERGLVEKIKPGDGYGPAVWRLCEVAQQPDGVA